MNITQSVVVERDRALIGGDYAGYHVQAVRRLHALRRRLGTATPRGRKYTPKTPVTAANVGQNAEWVQLLLASSERAWAHAMAMKSLQSPENTQKQMPGSTKRQIASRYRRAITYAANLVETLQDQATSKSSNIDILESTAYLSMLRGGLDFEKSRWQSCIQNYAVSRLIYASLAVKAKSDMYNDILDTTVDPSIRYAAYQLKLPRTKSTQDIAIEAFPTSDSSLQSEIQNIDSQAFTTSSKKSLGQSDGPTNLPTAITWRSRNVKLEDASISQALGVAQNKEAALVEPFEAYQKGNTTSKDLAAAFDDVINARQDAVDITKNAIDGLRSEGVDQGDSRFQSIQVTRTALNYAVVEWRIGRNRVLCGRDDGLSFQSEAKNSETRLRKDGQARTVKEDSAGRKLAHLRERVTLYESILQNIEAVKELPGVIADTEFVDELEAKKAYFRALKCLTIGRSHSIEGRVPNALALYHRAAELATQVTSGIESSSSETDKLPKLEISSNQLEALTSYLASLVLRYRGLSELGALNNKTTSKDTKFTSPMVERLHNNQYEENIDLNNLVNYPPKLQPIPVKPLFFDVAWTYIQYPGRGAAESNGSVLAPVVEAVQEQLSKPTKKGWFGFGR